jgi:hypothetical protein
MSDKKGCGCSGKGKGTSKDGKKNEPAVGNGNCC